MIIHDIRDPLSVSNADMTESSIVDTKLASARFDNVDLHGATFTNVDLSGVAYRDVNFAGVSIANANLTGTTIDGVPIDDMMRAYRNRESGGRTAGAVLYAKHLMDLRQFYQQLLGFASEHASTDHVVLGASGFRLVLVAVPPAMAVSIDVESPPRLRAESPTKLIFPTTSIAAVRAAAADFGGAVLPPDREWDFDGTRVCDGNDPEGNIFQLWQMHAGDTHTGES